MKNITTSTLEEHKSTMNTIARTMGLIFATSCKKKLNGIDQKLALAPCGFMCNVGLGYAHWFKFKQSWF
jgi:hypothetical protein